MADIERPVTVTEVAEMFSVNPKTVARWADEGSVPSFRTPGGHRRFYRSELDRVIESRRRRATGQEEQ